MNSALLPTDVYFLEIRKLMYNATKTYFTFWFELVVSRKLQYKKNNPKPIYNYIYVTLNYICITFRFGNLTCLPFLSKNGDYFT